ncbi:hypothetical protein KJK34_03360 [Flavobacterium sp. D11R37]|uniref:hypothetical protein n=1 Tax=Flavobacterium coralii TaxID=2838017 RepID=UPI001CA66B50|nr:hypothetical protein [Flavobacterium coralii]MBY8961785.1 hypothetical protein [Flavobacterium coralii]
MKNSIYTYQWMSGEGFLFPSIFNTSKIIEGKIGHKTSEIIDQINSSQGYFLFHINLTYTNYFFEDRKVLIEALLNKNLVPINANITNTTKRNIQELCKKNKINTVSAKEEGDLNELLIIKTDYNYAGISESKLTSSEKKKLQIIDSSHPLDIYYKIMPRKNVEKGVWYDSSLVVEKFINNKQNLFYRVHKLFNHLVVTEMVDSNLIRKVPDGLPVLNYYYDLDIDYTQDKNFLRFNSIITQIQKLSIDAEIDYAAFDVVKSDNDNYYIIDINLTPYWGYTDNQTMFNFIFNALQ